MDWSVIVTPQAREDLRQIVSFIARHDSERARNFGNRLLDKALSLVQLPERGRMVPEQNNPDIREIIHQAYRIVYLVTHHTETIYVLRFWHSARGTPELFGE